MSMNKIMAAHVLIIVVGAAMAVCSAIGLIEEFWGVMGVVVMLNKGIQLARMIRIKTNADYRSRVQVEKDDERNRYIGMKAWSMAGYMFVVIAAVAAIMLKVAGREDLMYMASGSVCLIMLLYWGSWLYLRRKY